MHEGETLAGLVQGAVEGDTRSFRMLMQHLDQKLFVYVRSRTATRDEAMDTLQDVLVAIWQGLKGFEYRSDAAFYRFVYTIARRKLSKIHRSTTLSLEDVDDISDTSFADGAVDRVGVQTALATLEPVARDIVTLRHWSRFSFKEIGDLLSMKEEAVRVRHHRALATLRTKL